MLKVVEGPTISLGRTVIATPFSVTTVSELSAGIGTNLVPMTTVLGSTATPSDLPIVAVGTTTGGGATFGVPIKDAMTLPGLGAPVAGAGAGLSVIIAGAGTGAGAGA